jgi:hypothetical protein
MSRDALNNQQFDLMITNEREVEQKRRQDRSGIYCPEPPEKKEKPREP